MNFIKLILFLLIFIFICTKILSSAILKLILSPIDNKKLKNNFINSIIIYRINYFNSHSITEFNKNIYNKILSKQYLTQSELKYLNKKI